MTATPSRETTERLLRTAAPQALGALVRRFGDFADCEDALQEALLDAVQQWPRDGVPANPRGWLIHVAARRMGDHLRRQRARRAREAATHERLPDDEYTAPGADEDAARAEDDTPALLFMCCHPALTSTSAIALTLRAVGGLTTAEIAHAFLVPEATMAQRISRAKQSLRASAVPFALPDARERAARLPMVLHVLYLIFNEGYARSAGRALQGVALAEEAIRLTRALHRLLPNEAEIAGLLALMQLTHARRSARTTDDGALVPLDAQDRRLWDHDLIAEGIALLERTLPRGAVGPYQLQAAIAAVHDEAARAEDTDWPQILALYELLMRLSDNPMIALNHAIAVAMVRGAQAGLERLSALTDDPRLARHHRLYAVRAHLLAMAGDRKAAVVQFREAAARTASVPERDYLGAQAASLMLLE